MDRLNRTLAGCGLALLLAASGCKSTQSTVPPGRSYSSDGRQAPPIQFSSDPHPMQANANPALGASPTSPGNVAPQIGTPAPNAGNYGVPSAGNYGAPGSSGVEPAAGPGRTYPPQPTLPAALQPGAGPAGNQE